MSSMPRVTQGGFETSEPEVANNALGRMYGDVRSWVFGDPEGFTYRLRSAATERLATAHMCFTMGFGIDAELAPSHHTVLAMLGGDHYHVKSQYGDVVLQAGDVAVVPAGAALQVSLEALNVITLSVPADDLSRTAEELYGIAQGDFAIQDMAPSPRAKRYFSGLARLASRELLTPDSALQHPLIYEETLRGLCTGLLGTFPTSAAANSRLPGAGDVAPRALRRAIAFIDANAARPITITEVAAAAGTSARAVQHAFARHLETTPTAYLRRVRLERAHRELQAGDPARGDTVAAIARRWGYSRAGRFAAAYRDAFGINPNQTLRG